MAWKGCGTKFWNKVRYYTSISLGGTGKNHDNPWCEQPFLGQDMNLILHNMKQECFPCNCDD
jgi:hypothetical protein